MTHIATSQTIAIPAHRRILVKIASFFGSLAQSRRDGRLLSGLNDAQLRDIGPSRDHVRQGYGHF